MCSNSYQQDVITATRVLHVTMTTTVSRKKLWLYENKLHPYTKKCLFIAVHLEVLQLFWLWWSGMTMHGS